VSILWGKGRDLDYWAALQADEVPAAEKRAMILLASMSDERRFSFYCLSGMFPAMGDVTKRIYLVRRWTTVLELEDGRPRASWCILAQDRQIAPESDHVIAMKNLLEGSELHFREVGNAFHYSQDPWRGSVDPRTAFPNPYYNQIGPARSMPPINDHLAQAHHLDWNEDSALQFRELENWIKTLKLKAELPTAANFAEGRRQSVRSAAAFRPQLLRDALIERAKDWVRIPPKDRYRLPASSFERMADRAMGVMNNIGAAYGLGAGQAQAGFVGTTANTAQTTFTNVTFGNPGVLMGPWMNATIA